jgi:hypothetical protein
MRHAGGRPAGGILACVALCLLPGCGGAPPEPVAVKGKVVFEKKGVSWVRVTFWPQKMAVKPASAVCDLEGRFSLKCVPGNYKVTVIPIAQEETAPGIESGKAAADPARPKTPVVIAASYREASTTELTVEVPEGGKEDVVLRLK